MKCSTSSAATKPSPTSSPGWTRAPRRRAEALLAGLALLALAANAAAAPKAERWERWAAHDEASAATIPHDAWSSFLARYLKPGADGVNRLAYERVTAQDRKALDGYVRSLERVTIGKHARAEQRAYWINLYNAATVRVVLEHYPVPSIMDIDISPGWFARGPWQKKLLTVEGEPLSLDDIEHRILRPLWRDPRTHYAVNCASIGCPNLAPEAYTAANLEALLEQGARDYVNHPRGAAVRDGALVVSSIYVWFQEDFGGSDAGVLDHLRRYAGPALARHLSGVTAIADHAYDWSLNEAR